MALIKCPACQHDVSDEAVSCPACGHPLKAPPLPPPVARRAQPVKKQSTWWIGCIIAGGIGLLAIPVIGMLAAIAIPSFVKARSVTQEKLCVNNIRMIEHAKDALAVERDAKTGDVLPLADIKAHLGQSQPEGRVMSCPRDPQKSFETSYVPGAVGEDAVCLHHRSGSTAHSHSRAPPSAREPRR
jgi:hypothetical protein